MLKFLNAGFGEPLGHELPALRDLGVQGIRSDNQKNDADTTLARTQEITAAGLVPLIVVSGIAQLEKLPARTFVELLNEPDLEGPAARVYASQVEMFAGACEARGLVLWAGVVSNLNNRGFKYLKDARIQQWPASVNVSVHFYPDKDSPHDPHPGFKSREHEVETLKALIGDRQWGVSEFGYRTSLPTAAASIAFEWQFWERHGAQLAALFQLNDGKGKGEHFGIRNLADGTWKDAARTFARTT